MDAAKNEVDIETEGECRENDLIVRDAAHRSPPGSPPQRRAYEGNLGAQKPEGDLDLSTAEAIKGQQGDSEVKHSRFKAEEPDRGVGSGKDRDAAENSRCPLREAEQQDENERTEEQARDTNCRELELLG